MAPRGCIHPRPLAERLAEKIDASAGPDACHPWTAARSAKRRGRRGVIHVTGGGRHRVVIAARVVLALSPNGVGLDWNCPLEVRHSCGNGGNEVDCHNWRHLRWGTRQENEDDKKIQRQRARAPEGAEDDDEVPF